MRNAPVTAARGSILLAVLLLFSGCSGSKATGPAETGSTTPPSLVVKAARPSVEDWMVTVPFSGSLRSQSIVEIKTEAGGKLLSALFEEGQAVEKGQLLAEIDPANYRLARDQAEAAVTVAQANQGRARVMLDHAVREKERAENLWKTGGITEKDLQMAVTSVKEAESQVRLAEAQQQQARSALAIAEKSLADCRIFAFSQGSVYRKFFDVGSLLSPGSPVYTLVDNARLELRFLVQSNRLAEIRPGQKAFFTTPTFGDRRFAAVVKAINPMVEEESRSVRIDLDISNPRGELRSGMFARGEIEVRREPNALIIPRSSFVADEVDSAAGVVFVIENNIARRRSLQLGGSREERFWIRQGLTAQDQVILEIGPSLREGIAVTASGAGAVKAGGSGQVQ
jgi:RND family efflux transporter MFP subunit